jgi:hypothetical protein
MMLMFGILDHIDDVLAMAFVCEKMFKIARWYYRKRYGEDGGKGVLSFLFRKKDAPQT